MTQVSDAEALWRAALLEGAAELGLPLAAERVEAYRSHFAVLLAHNLRAGLTTITDPVEVAIKHFLDSLSGLLVRDIAPGERVADVGSGGGFPGLVLAVARPRATFALIESSRKRAAFLGEAARVLRLPNVTVSALRAEQVGKQPDHRERYHLVVSRAVAPMPALLECSLPLARVGGHFLAYKGPEVDGEMKQSGPALTMLGGRLARTRRLSLPRQMGARALVLVEKIAATPPAYPRRPGIPEKRPLGGPH